MEQAIPPRCPVTLTYPYPPLLQPLLWQSADGYRFSILGGYARHSNAARSVTGFGAGLSASPIPMNPPELQQFLLANDDLSSWEYTSAQVPGARITPRLLKATPTALVRYRVQVVLVDRSSAGALHVLKLFRTMCLARRTTTLDSYSMWVQVQRTLKQSATLPALPTPPPPRPIVPPPTPAPATHVYVVQPGDTLWALAARYLGNPLRYQELFDLNRGISQVDGYTLVDPNLIYPGMKLLFPADATGLPPPAL